jgi:hypothetical protein
VSTNIYWVPVFLELILYLGKTDVNALFPSHFRQFQIKGCSEYLEDRKENQVNSARLVDGRKDYNQLNLDT